MNKEASDVMKPPHITNTKKGTKDISQAGHLRDRKKLRMVSTTSSQKPKVHMLIHQKSMIGVTTQAKKPIKLFAHKKVGRKTKLKGDVKTGKKVIKKTKKAKPGDTAKIKLQKAKKVSDEEKQPKRGQKKKLVDAQDKVKKEHKKALKRQKDRLEQARKLRLKRAKRSKKEKTAKHKLDLKIKELRKKIK